MFEHEAEKIKTKMEILKLFMQEIPSENAKLTIGRIRSSVIT